MPDNPQGPQPGWKKAGVPKPEGKAAPKAPAWKQGAGGASGPAAGAQAGRGWKRAPSAAGPRQPMSRRTKFLLGGALFTAVVGVFAWVVLWPTPLKGFRLVVLTAANEKNLEVPHNVHGRRTAERLSDWGRRLAEWDPKKFEVKPRAALTHGLAGLKEALEKCNNETVVVYLAAHGAADESGPYLIAEGADLRHPDKARVYLRDVLACLRELRNGTRKLLLLDATQIDASWSLGVVHNDFARALAGMKQDIEAVPGLVVISSGGENERSWVSEEWRQTAFGHFLVEGLQGGADTGRDTRITARELGDYLKDRVRHWARHNRGTVQAPELLGAGAETMELVSTHQPAAPPAPELPRFQVPPQLHEAWLEADALAGPAGPAPAVHAPHLWRRYLETLLRYEELLRADDREAAEAMRAQLPRLKDRIEKLARRKLDSALNSLAMPEALGWPTSAADEKRLTADLAAVWEAKEKDRPAAFNELLDRWLGDKVDPWRRSLLRVRLHKHLLDRAAEPGRDLTEVRDLLLGKLDLASVPRPAESHHFVMLTRDLLPEAPRPVAAAAFAARREAEAAALGLGGEGAAGPPCSERLLPWLAADVEKADDTRRRGDDKLLGARDEDWGDAARLVTGAAEQYRAIQRRAAALRRAFVARDTALATLPYYSQWLARQDFTDKAPRADPAERVRRTLKLWEKCNQLDQLLREANPASEARVVTLGQEVSDGLAALAGEFVRACKEQPGAALPKNWHAIDALLAVPLIDAETRRHLLGLQGKISAELHTRADAKGGDAPVIPAEQARDLARLRATEGAKLALAALGESAFDRAQPAKPRLDRPLAERFIHSTDPAVWQSQLGRAADEVGLRWNRVAGAAEGLAAEARKLAPEKAGQLVRDAGALARRLSGAQAARLDTDPLEEERQLQLHDLLCWQGRRTALDFWAAEKRDRAHYYRAAGRIYAEDAAAEIKGSQDRVAPGRLARYAALTADLADDARLPKVAWAAEGGRIVTGRGPLALTDEESLPVVCFVQATAATPPGHPALREEIDGAKGFLLPPPPAQARRTVLARHGPDRASAATVTYPLRPDPASAGRPEKVMATQVVRGLFRGHQFEGGADVSYSGMAETESAQPPMARGAAVAIQAEKHLIARLAQGSGQLVLVLDCSWSMVDPKNPLHDGKTRFQVATEVLGKLLADLPRGVQLSLWVYGQKHDLDGTSLAQFEVKAEHTIRRLFTTKEWNPDKEFEPLVKRVSALEPYGNTPLVHSMQQAIADFTNKRGFKTLVILTDGMDTRWVPAQREANPNGPIESIPDALHRLFAKTDIDVRVVGFDVDPKVEKPLLEAQFKMPLERLPRKGQGRFFDARNVQGLIEALRQSLPQRLLFFPEELDFTPVKGYAEGMDVGLIGGNKHWVDDLRGENYYTVVDAVRLRQRVAVKAGDRLLLNLREPKKNVFLLERSLLAESHPNVKKLVRNKDWQMTVLQNERGERDLSLQMTVALESLTHRTATGEGSIGHVRPHLILFQVARKVASGAAGAKGKPPAPSVRYYPQANLAAPAWRLDVKPWEPDDAPEVEAFWTVDDPSVAARFRRGVNFDDELNVFPSRAEEPARLTAQRTEPVRLWPISFIKRQVPTIDGKSELVDCMVVRLSYPEGLPVLLQSPQFTRGVEHRMYTAVNKYTGIFWPVTREQAREVLDTLTVISVEGFRDVARATRQHLKVTLGKPDRGEQQ